MIRLLLAASLAIPLGLDLYLPVPEDNPLTVERIVLGRRLFSDRRLSRDGLTACVTCHDPGRAFGDGRPLAVGVFGRVGRRHAPALINRGYGRAFFWDARLTTLEEQVLKPIEDPNEMDLPVVEAAARVGLDRAAFSEEQQTGLQIFRGKGNCTACHVGPTFTDERLHNTGVAWRPQVGVGGLGLGTGAGTFDDLGRAVVTGLDADRGAFKTPTLREVARTAPYMHDGSLATLGEVVRFYDEGGRANPNRDPELHPLNLTASEKQAVIAFLHTLTGTVRDGVANMPSRSP